MTNCFLSIALAMEEKAGAGRVAAFPMELLFRGASLFLDNRNECGARYVETTESRHCSHSTLFKYAMQNTYLTSKVLQTFLTSHAFISRSDELL